MFKRCNFVVDVEREMDHVLRHASAGSLYFDVAVGGVIADGNEFKIGIYAPPGFEKVANRGVPRDARYRISCLDDAFLGSISGVENYDSHPEFLSFLASRMALMSIEEKPRTLFKMTPSGEIIAEWDVTNEGRLDIAM